MQSFQFSQEGEAEEAAVPGVGEAVHLEEEEPAAAGDN